MHFFIDHLGLNDQLPDDGFGPAAANPSNIYNVTSRFKLASLLKAFACEAGTMVVQQSVVDSTLVNLIIKPDLNLDALADVTYYVYRGILKDSLIAGGCVLQNTGDNNELLARIWAQPPADTSCGTLGYDQDTIPDADTIESIFDNSRTDVKPVFVKEGEWIGTFGKDFKIGFEVLLNTQRFIVTLGYVRAEQYQVDVTGLAGMALRIKREEILNFVDPAAFFGLHFNQKVGYSEYNPTKVTRRTSSVASNAAFIYTKLLQKFTTRNRIYLDIRSEKGYSYNFYQNYGEAATHNNIDIAFQAGAGVPQVYQMNGWPILCSTASQSTTETANNLKIKLRIDDNTVPIIYIKNKSFKDAKRESCYIKEDDIRVNATTLTWSKRLQFNFANIGTGSARLGIANYIKFSYLRQRHNVAAPAGTLWNEKYYDSAFCSIDLPDLGVAAAVKKFSHSAEPIYVREPNNTDGTGNFGLNMSNGAYWDANRVLFYCTFQYDNSAKRSEKEYINTYNQKLTLANPDYMDSRAYTATEILCRSYEVDGSVIRIPSINLFRGVDLGAAKNYKENALLLGLTVAQVASLKADTQLDRLHHRFIHLQADASNPQISGVSHRYFRYTVQLQGMLGNANPTRVTPLHAGNPIVVYSRDNQFFSSAEFSATETVTVGQNRIEYHIFHDGCVKITDNRDLALVHDLERIHYFYYNAANVAVEVCNLAVVMADKMRRVSYSSAQTSFPGNIPASFVQFFDYRALAVPGVSAYASFRNNNGDIFTSGTDGNRKYLNQKKKVFLVHFERDRVVAVASLAIDFNYVSTLRHYARPDVAAAVIGALIQLNHPIICQGFAYADASCYPSAEHVNGEAMDTNYNFTFENDVAFVNALNRFGFGLHRVGRTTYLTSLHNHDPHDGTVRDPPPAPGKSPLHNSHLHSTKLSLPDCQRDL